MGALFLWKGQHYMNIGYLWLQTVITAAGGFLGWYLGGIDGAMYTLVVFVAVDYISGVLCAVQDRALSSKIGSRGIFKKVMIFALVGIAHMVDRNVLGHDGVLRTATIFFFLSNEGISILENAAHLGLPIPARLKNVLANLNDGKENNWALNAQKEDMDGGCDDSAH
jgi:toxin secretion/phage lysis holin